VNLNNVTFKEKSTWVSLVIMLFVYYGYFSRVLDGFLNNSLNKGENVGLFIGAVVVLVIFQVVFQIIAALSNVKDADQPTDERDRLFAVKAGNASGWVLSGCVLTIALLIFVEDLNSIWAANLLVLALVISQVVCYIVTLFYYRRGY